MVLDSLFEVLKLEMGVELALQDALCAFVPPEEAVRVTRLTGQALLSRHCSKA